MHPSARLTFVSWFVKLPWFYFYIPNQLAAPVLQLRSHCAAEIAAILRVSSPCNCQAIAILIGPSAFDTLSRNSVSDLPIKPYWRGDSDWHKSTSVQWLLHCPWFLPLSDLLLRPYSKFWQLSSISNCVQLLPHPVIIIAKRGRGIIQDFWSLRVFGLDVGG